MSNFLSTVYSSLFEFFLASNKSYRLTKFKELGERLVASDLSNLGPMHDVEMDAANDKWINQRPPLLLHDQEPMFYKAQSHTYEYWRFCMTSFDDRMVVLTSEKNSPELDEFCKAMGAEPCYWFSNAALALEWYAKGEWNLKHQYKHLTAPRLHYKFSCVNRLIDGERSYRPVISKFLSDTVDHRYLRLSCNLRDPVSGKAVSQLELPSKYARMLKDLDHNEPLMVNIPADDLETDGSIPNRSYDLCHQYFLPVFCHVVTETLFIGKTLHLTEKSLRAFANKRPMLMLGPPGTLDLLRSYGFKTFDRWWDESYDNIDNPWDRLEAVMKIVSQINSYSFEQLESILDQMMPILKHNFDLFYGDFKKIIMQELVTNLQAATAKAKAKPPSGWMIKRIESLTDEQIRTLISSDIGDEIPNKDLYASIKLGDYSRVDKNLSRFLKKYLEIKEDASKADILASIRLILD